jgi:hypothetical protein
MIPISPLEERARNVVATDCYHSEISDDESGHEEAIDTIDACGTAIDEAPKEQSDSGESHPGRNG